MTTRREIAESQMQSIELASWRRKLMPFTLFLILAGSAFFIWVSYQQFAQVASSLNQPDSSSEIAKFIRSDFGANNSLEPAAKAQLLMAERAQQASLTRANASMLLSLWTRNMGFVTGMILAMVGAAFILSRLDDAGNELIAEHGSIKGSLKTSSPGIVMAVLGVILMIMAMTVRYTEAGKEVSQTSVAPQASTPIIEHLPDDDSGSEAQDSTALKQAK